MKKINVKLLIVFVSLMLAATFLKAITIQTTDQLFLIVFNYINKNRIMYVYNDFLYILPYFIIFCFILHDIRPFFENEAMLKVRFVTSKENFIFLLIRILKTVCKYVLLSSVSLFIYSLIFHLRFTGFLNIVFILINIILIEISSALLYWFLINLFQEQYALLISILAFFLVPMTGFLGAYINNTSLSTYNLMTVNTVFSYQLPLHLTFHFMIHFINIIVIFLCVIYTFYFTEA